MIENALVYISSALPEKRFVGCGVLVEGSYVATCRHVWRMATEEAEGQVSVQVDYPGSRRSGAVVCHLAELADTCDVTDDAAPDLVLLRPEAVPPGIISPQLATHHRFEVGPGYALVGFVRSGTIHLVRIEGEIADHTDLNGRRQFTGGNAQGYWSDRGSSGSPVFLNGGQQLAGIVSLSETGASDSRASPHEAFIVPATTIRKLLTARLAAPIAESRGIDSGALHAILAKIGGIHPGRAAWA